MLIVAVLIFTFGVTEVALRVVDFSYPNFMTHDEHTGMRLRSNAHGWYRDEGEAYVRINRHGLRDRDHALEKPAGTVRIAILGDSYAEARQVPVEQAFSARLEKELGTCRALNGLRVEVLNFGVSGYSTAQELLMLRHYVWPFQPDLVVLAFLSGNDVRDNSQAISGRYPRPFFILKDGQLVLDNSFRESFLYQLKSSWIWDTFADLSNSVRVMQLFNKAKNRLGQPLSAPQSEQLPDTNLGSEAGIDDAIYLEPRSHEWQEAWTITEHLISTMHKEVRSRDATFLLVGLTNGIQVHPNSTDRDRYARQLGVADLFYPDRRVGALAKREGIPHLMLAPLLQQHAHTYRKHLHGFPNTQLGRGHWNKEGHDVASQLMADHICRNKLIGSAKGLERARGRILQPVQ